MLRAFPALFVLGVVGASLLAGCGKPSTPMHSAQDVRKVWEAHGLQPTFSDHVVNPQDGVRERWWVSGPRGSGVLMFLYVADSPAEAQALRVNRGPFLTRQYIHGNIVLAYRDDPDVMPYLVALGSLR